MMISDSGLLFGPPCILDYAWQRGFAHLRKHVA